MRSVHFVIIALLGAAMVAPRAAELTLKTMAKEPPKELAEAIRLKVQPRVIQLSEGEKPVYEIWLASEGDSDGFYSKLGARPTEEGSKFFVFDRLTPPRGFR